MTFGAITHDTLLWAIDCADAEAETSEQRAVEEDGPVLQSLADRRVSDLRLLNKMAAAGASDVQLVQAASKLKSAHPIEFCASRHISIDY